MTQQVSTQQLIVSSTNHMANKGKTRKAYAKRFTVKKTGKVIHRTGGQDHFNAREPGKVTRQNEMIEH